MTILPVKEFSENKYIIACTRNGVVKKTELMAYSNPRQGGIIGMNIDEGDALVATRITNGDMDILMGSEHGKSIRFSESDVRSMGRTARGVRGMQLMDGDRIIGMEVVTDATSATLVTVTEKGFGKRTSIDEYKTQSRGGKGIITIKTSARNGCVVDIKLVSPEEDLMFITDKGKVLRTNVGDLSIIGRNTQGVRLMVLDSQERIGAVATMAEKVEEDIVAEALNEDAEEE